MVVDDPESFADLNGHVNNDHGVHEGGASQACEYSIDGLCVPGSLSGSEYSNQNAEDEAEEQRDAQKQSQYTATPQANVDPYTVQGATADDAIANSKKGPNAPESGRTDGAKVSADGDVTSCVAGVCTAHVTVVSFQEIKMSLPQWAGFAKAAKSEQSEWTHYLNTLIRHENGHVKDFKDIHVRERLALEHLGATGSSPANALRNLGTKVKAVESQYLNLSDQWSKSYDQRTCHGGCQ
jgi:predicted secreted Zn-dependent protease